ncbi:aldehyde dehydrogenase family protein [Luteibacter aegosomatissinici]|uniref:aldehyde dehydrogenase family protein n=1 Tax=Luteibacter aegosomatissinici TaxID=2911539 RepID=UPI001FF9FE9A|nr:aldehyde dehydrogenase family protein [Luteibacter aegosomatissinici]UPG96708.1 aldehyde dehydrogenase family protein [Luteibacter aegosomatissinici]
MHCPGAATPRRPRHIEDSTGPQAPEGAHALPFASINPSSGELIVEFAPTTERALNAILERADLAFRGDWGRAHCAVRGNMLRAAADSLRENRMTLARTATLEMGKRLTEALFEIEAAAGLFEVHADSIADERLGDIAGHGPSPGLCDAAPVGVVLCVETWNFPFFELARVAAPNLAAGNTVIARHSSRLPLCAAAFERVVRAAGLPMGAFSTVFLTDDLLERALLDTRVHGVSMHGTHRRVAACAMAAGKALQLMSHEPAGTDVFAVLDDADVGLAVDLAVEGRLANCGQMCSGARRFLVTPPIARAFTEQLAAAMAARIPAEPGSAATLLGPVASRAGLEHSLDLMGKAMRAGAQLLTGGRRVDRPGFYLEPAVLAMGADDPAFSEDFLGPVAMVATIGGDDDVVRIANRKPGGLGGSIVSQDTDRALRVARQFAHGRVYINETALSRKARLGTHGPQGAALSQLPVRAFVHRRTIHMP